MTVAVRTGGPGHGGLSLLVVERGTPGFTVSQAARQDGLVGLATPPSWRSTSCRVPVANRIGEEGQGFAAIVQNFVSERLFIAGQCVAVAELAYHEAVAYARERHAFGKPLVGFQVTRHKLADMAARLAAARALTGEVRHALPPRRAARRRWRRWPRTSPRDMCSFVCDEAVQLHGGAGYLRGTVVERLYRDARLYPIGGGTREIMNEIIAKAEGY